MLPYRHAVSGNILSNANFINKYYEFAKLVFEQFHGTAECPVVVLKDDVIYITVNDKTEVVECELHTTAPNGRKMILHDIIHTADIFGQTSMQYIETQYSVRSNYINRASIYNRKAV